MQLFFFFLSFHRPAKFCISRELTVQCLLIASRSQNARTVNTLATPVLLLFRKNHKNCGKKDGWTCFVFHHNVWSEYLSPQRIFCTFFTPDVDTAICALYARRQAYRMSDVFICKFLIKQPYFVVRLSLSCYTSPGGHDQVSGRIWSATLNRYVTWNCCVSSHIPASLHLFLMNWLRPFKSDCSATNLTVHGW